MKMFAVVCVIFVSVIQIGNTMDKETLEWARENPEEYAAQMKKLREFDQIFEGTLNIFHITIPDDMNEQQALDELANIFAKELDVDPNTIKVTTDHFTHAYCNFNHKISPKDGDDAERINKLLGSVDFTHKMQQSINEKFAITDTPEDQQKIEGTLEIIISDDRDEQQQALDQIANVVANELSIDANVIKVTKHENGKVKYEISPKDKDDAERIQWKNLDERERILKLRNKPDFVDKIQKSVQEKFAQIPGQEDQQNKGTTTRKTADGRPFLEELGIRTSPKHIKEKTEQNTTSMENEENSQKLLVEKDVRRAVKEFLKTGGFKNLKAKYDEIVDEEHKEFREGVKNYYSICRGKELFGDEELTREIKEDFLKTVCLDAAEEILKEMEVYKKKAENYYIVQQRRKLTYGTLFGWFITVALNMYEPNTSFLMQVFFILIVLLIGNFHPPNQVLN